MPTKVNIVLDDDVKADLDRLVESGKRSRVINNALRREIHLMSRSAAERAPGRYPGRRPGPCPLETS